MKKQEINFTRQIFGVENSYLFSKFVQVGKGKDRKTFLCRVRYKKCWAEGNTFFYVKLCKNYFLIETFPYKNKILRTHNFFIKTALL